MILLTPSFSLSPGSEFSITDFPGEFGFGVGSHLTLSSRVFGTSQKCLDSTGAEELDPVIDAAAVAT